MGWCDNCWRCGYFYDHTREDVCPKCGSVTDRGETTRQDYQEDKK